MRIDIPTINDSPGDFELLFNIRQKVENLTMDVSFDFSYCNFLRPNACAFLGGLSRLLESKGRKAHFNWNSLKPEIINNLSKNSFASKFGYTVAKREGNSVPYREDLEMNVDGIMNYLTDDWLGRGWVHVSEELKNAIAGKLWEIFNNSFEHAGSQIGVFSCGQHFPNLNCLVLTIIDFGQGIASNVRNFLKVDPRAKNLNVDNCLKWAFTRGNTTLPNGIARGIGLDLLKKFINANKGKIEVFSNEGYVCIENNNESYHNLSSNFDGTIFHISLVCDENYYKLADE